jgi:hypothetical protein
VEGLYGTALADSFNIVVVDDCGSRMITQAEINHSQQGSILSATSKGAITVEIPTKFSSSPPDKSFRPSVRAFSPDEDVLQSLIDTQLSNTGEPYGIIVVTNDDDSSSGEPDGKIRMTSDTTEVIERNSEESKEAAYVQTQALQLPEDDALLKHRPSSPDNTGDTILYPTEEDHPIIKDEPEPEDIFMQELIETAEIFTPLPSVDTSLDIVKDDSETSLKATFEESKHVLETKPMKSANTSETKQSVVKVANKVDVSKLFDRHRASLLVRTAHATSTSTTEPAYSDVLMANTKHSASIVDLTKDDGARRARPKKHQTLFGPQRNEESLNAVDLTTDPGQDSTSLTMPSNTQSGAEETNNVDTTTCTTDAGPDLHEVVDAADDDDLQIIGTATVRRRHRVRTTVLTVRSRSVSESLTFAAGATPHPRGKQS